MRVVSWAEVNDYINSLEIPVNATGVYGIPRGGLVLAVMASHKYNLPLLQAPCKNCIVIDDIADTGITLEHYKEKGYYITTMFYHKQSKVTPDWWAFEKKKEWIIFPWENIGELECGILKKD